MIKKKEFRAFFCEALLKSAYPLKCPGLLHKPQDQRSLCVVFCLPVSVRAFVEASLSFEDGSVNFESFLWY